MKNRYNHRFLHLSWLFALLLGWNFSQAQVCSDDDCPPPFAPAVQHEDFCPTCCEDALTVGFQNDCMGGDAVAVVEDTIPVPNGLNTQVTGQGFPIGGQFEWYDAFTNGLVQVGPTVNLPQGDWYMVYATDVTCFDTTFFTTIPVDNQIFGQLWFDQNFDGANNDPLNPIVENIEIHLLDTNGIIRYSTLTDNLGNYLFDDILPNIYELRIDVLPAGLSFTQPGGGSDLEPVCACIPFFPIDAFFPPQGINIGVIPLDPYVITGKIWNDENGNGIQEPGEGGIPDLEVIIESPNYGPHHVFTDPDGNYGYPLFPQYEDIIITIPTPEGGGTYSPQDVGPDDNVDSDFDPFGVYTQPAPPFQLPNPTLDVDLGIKRPVKVKITSIIGGAVRNDGEMGTELQDGGLLPTTEPYSGLGYSVDNPGINLVQAVVPDMVDWVTVELRDKNDSTQVVASQSLVIRKNGCIVDPITGKTPCFDVDKGSYFVAVRHRNSLDVMTAHPVFLDDQDFEVDFTDPNQPTTGINDQKTEDSGLNSLWGGDASGDNELKYSGPSNDRQSVLIIIGGVDPTQTTTPGYYMEDTNLDGTSKYSGPNSDRQVILQNIGGTDPTETKKSGLPN